MLKDWLYTYNIYLHTYRRIIETEYTHANLCKCHPQIIAIPNSALK